MFLEHIFLIFPKTRSLLNILSIDQLSISDLLSLSKYQTKCVFKFEFSQLMALQTLRFNFHHLFEQWLTEGKRWEKGIAKIRIS